MSNIIAYIFKVLSFIIFIIFLIDISFQKFNFVDNHLTIIIIIYFISSFIYDRLHTKPFFEFIEERFNIKLPRWHNLFSLIGVDKDIVNKEKEYQDKNINSSSNNENESKTYEEYKNNKKR